MGLIYELGNKLPSNIPEYSGIVFVGDPHLEARQPGFRKDNYQDAILGKLRWIFDLAKRENYLPVFLGDFFERPRDNPNRLMGRLIEMFAERDCVTNYGNHDCSEPVLTEDDSLSLLLKGSRLQLISATKLASLRIAGKLVLIGGSSYREKLPVSFSAPVKSEKPFVCWITHHDLVQGSSDSQRFGIQPSEIPGVDAVINGHLHRKQVELKTGQTQWFVPGNISRRSRHEATASQKPNVLMMTFYLDSPQFEYLEVPHLPPEDVFHEKMVIEENTEVATSSFVQGLAELESLRTETGAGLVQFLQMNQHQFSPEVNAYIERLRQEVMEHVE